MDFGTVSVNTMTKQKVELCNVFLGDTSLPFLLLHNEITPLTPALIRAHTRPLCPCVRRLLLFELHFQLYLRGRKTGLCRWEAGRGRQGYKAALEVQLNDGLYHANVLLAGDSIW